MRQAISRHGTLSSLFGAPQGHLTYIHLSPGKAIVLRKTIRKQLMMPVLLI
jgi:hypothetical protein